MQKSQISVTVTKGVKTGKNDSNRGLKKSDLTFPRGDLTFLEPVLSQNPLEFEKGKFHLKSPFLHVYAQNPLRFYIKSPLRNVKSLIFEPQNAPREQKKNDSRQSDL
jgi:hypothetical protein